LVHDIPEREYSLWREKKTKQSERESQKMAKVYVTKAGDSLSKIAKAVYGDADRWQEIFEANKGKIQDPDKISVGLKLRIP
jgi:nucleoid-associated protein YgaU